MDFQTFHFGTEFSGFTRVEIPTFGWSLDNLVVVPELDAWSLIILGGVVATILCWKAGRGRLRYVSSWVPSGIMRIPTSLHSVNQLRYEKPVYYSISCMCRELACSFGTVRGAATNSHHV